MKNLLVFFVVIFSGLSATAASFTFESAPDAISKEILSHSIPILFDKSAGGQDQSLRIHKIFPQIIEQNIAKLDSTEVANLIDSLSEAELSDLSQLYVNAATDNGTPQKLLYVLAHRLDPQRLGRISRHFGFRPSYEAVLAVAAPKVQAFLNSSSTDDLEPTPGATQYGPRGRFASQAIGSRAFFSPAVLRNSDDPFSSTNTKNSLLKVGGFGQFMEMSPYEIYLDFRTAPIGALGVTGALWETSVVLSGTVGLAGTFGWYLGSTVIAPLIQTYAPSLWNMIGSSINTIINGITSSWSGGENSIGSAEATSSSQFQSTPAQTTGFRVHGGDYGAADEWCRSTGGDPDDGILNRNQY